MIKVIFILSEEIKKATLAFPPAWDGLLVLNFIWLTFTGDIYLRELSSELGN